MMSGIHQCVSFAHKDTMDRGSQCDIWRKLETSSAIGDIVSNMKKTGGDIVSDMKKTGENIVKSKDVIRNVIENILNEVVKERDATVDENGKRESSNNWSNTGVSVPGAFKLDHLQCVKLILSQKISISYHSYW